MRLRGEAGEDRTPARRRPEFLVLETSLPLLRCLCFIGFLLSESFRFTVQRVPGRPPACISHRWCAGCSRRPHQTGSLPTDLAASVGVFEWL